MLQVFQAVLPQGPVHIPGLAEPAAPDAAPLYLQDHPVLSHLDKRHQRFFYITHVIHIAYNLFCHHRHGMAVIGPEAFNGPVFLVGNIIKCRHIDTGYLCCQLQETVSVPASFLIFLVPVHQLKINGFPFADIEYVKEFSQWLRIVGAWSSAYYDGMLLCPVTCVKGNLGQIQYLEHVGVAHLILQGDSQEIKILHRILGLQGKQRDFLLPEYGIQIRPWGIHAFTVYVLPLVKHGVQNLDAQMGHADFVNVREAHGKADIYLGWVLFYHVDLAPDVAGGLLDT